VVNVDGLKTLEEEEAQADEVLQASLARTIILSVQETPVYRASGVKPGSGKPKVNKTELGRK
jgi:hypothetical protein